MDCVPAAGTGVLMGCGRQAEKIDYEGQRKENEPVVIGADPSFLHEAL